MIPDNSGQKLGAGVEEFTFIDMENHESSDEELEGTVILGAIAESNERPFKQTSKETNLKIQKIVDQMALVPDQSKDPIFELRELPVKKNTMLTEPKCLEKPSVPETPQQEEEDSKKCCCDFFFKLFHKERHHLKK
jgi:hypothetical protein